MYAIKAHHLTLTYKSQKPTVDSSDGSGGSGKCKRHEQTFVSILRCYEILLLEVKYEAQPHEPRDSES